MASKRKNKFEPTDGEGLTYKDAPRIAWMPVQDAVKFLSPTNPKLHDISSVMQSIQKYGFQELPKYDDTVGWIKAGNGRIEALSEMERAKDESGNPVYDVPRGLAVDSTGRWVMPIVTGTDAKDKNEALSYLVDSNNLTMMGGNFGALDLSKMWDVNEYNAILLRLAEETQYTISIAPETLVFMTSAQNALLDHYKEGKGGDEDIGDVLSLMVPVKITLLLGKRKYEKQAMEGIRKLIKENPLWEVEIEA